MVYALRLTRLSFRGRVFAIAGALFCAFVALRLHGSSIALTAQTWAPDTAMRRFVASPLIDAMQPSTAERWRGVLMAEPRYIRMDEWAHETPQALAQFSHVPRFPVVNRNIGVGHNMLTQPWVPVAHFSALARPMTWGYMLLGPEHGLAWAWWSQIFGCFVASYLLFELIVPGRSWLALLGAAWFCGSAYVVLWSLWPAYVAGLGLTALVAAYWLLKSSRPPVIIACGIVTALAVSGFVMQLYPPWQIPLSQGFVAIFAALLWRDRPWTSWRNRGRFRVYALGLAVTLSALLVGTFLAATWDALMALAHSEYPGSRRLNGGDCPAWRLFGGIYNAFTSNYFAPGANPSECAGFFLAFPAVVAALLVSPRLRSKAGPIIWTLLPLLVLWTIFSVTAVPAWFAKLTLLDRVPAFRGQIAVGLASIVVSVRLLAAAEGSPQDRETLLTGVAVFAVSAGLYFWQGRALLANWPVFGSGKQVAWSWIVPAIAGGGCALFVTGRARAFGALLVAALVVTSGTYNPLSIGFPDFRTTELYAAIRRISGRSEQAERNVWLTYGGPTYPINGVVAQVMGAQSLSGVHAHPQLELWNVLDPSGDRRRIYNRFAHVRLLPAAETSEAIDYRLGNVIALRVFISPFHPALRELGARYVLTFGDGRGVPTSKMTLLYRSTHPKFSIWELPDTTS